MRQLSELSDREIDALVARKIEGERCWPGARYGSPMPHYTASFDEALRVLRDQPLAQQVWIQAAIDNGVDGGAFGALMHERGARIICEAMLRAAGIDGEQEAIAHG